MLRRRVRTPVAPSANAPAELRDPTARVWQSFDGTRAWCESHGLSNGQAGWSAMAALNATGRHQVAAEWWAIHTGHFYVPGSVKVADWGHLAACGVPVTRQRRLRRRLDGVEIVAGRRAAGEDADA